MQRTLCQGQNKVVFDKKIGKAKILIFHNMEATYELRGEIVIEAVEDQACSSRYIGDLV